MGDRNLKNILNFKLFFPLFSTVLISSCATYTAQQGKNVEKFETSKQQPIYSFYLFGDSDGLQDQPQKIADLKEVLEQSQPKNAVLWLGNNADLISIKELQSSKEIPHFIANGEKEWQNGLDELKLKNKNQQQANLKVLSSTFCGIENVEINDSIAILSIDSQWFLEGWEENPDANADCPIQTREMFFTEFQNRLNDYENRTVLVVMHHPIISNGKYGGKFSVKDQLFPLDYKIPLPIAGSVINLVRATSGIDNQDLNNHFYRDLRQRLSTILANRDNVIVVSSHENSLQLLFDADGVKQIISGSLTQRKEAKASGKNDFSYGKNGFAKLNVYADGNSNVEFYSLEDEVAKIHQQIVTPKRKEYLAKVYDDQFSTHKTTSIYSQNQIDKSDWYQTFFGQHYREIYGRNIQANTLNFTHENLFPIREKEELQSINLRLQSELGKDFVLIPIKKNSTQLIQTLAYKNDYVANEFEDTFTQKFIQDFQTTQHPFYPLVVSEIAEKVNVNQLPSTLYYVPKQENLKEYNENFGDEFYLVEQYPKIQDSINKLLSTDELLTTIIENKNQKIDREQYIRTRLLDMLIGDWNRNESQWLWKRNVGENDTIYTPYSSTREFIFPKYDGAFFWLLMRLAPFRHMEHYSEKIKNVKWFNKIAYPLDLAVLQSSTEEEWVKQAEFLQQNLSEVELKNAFDQLPKDAKSEDDEKVISLLLSRKNQLVEYAKQYQKVLDKLVVLKGTNEAEIFTIDRLSKGETKITIQDKTSKEILFERVFDKKYTKEIRLFGLNGEDQFIEKGAGNQKIKVRLIGGLDQDEFTISSHQKLKIYENIDNQNLADKYKFDDYEINTYDYKNPKYNTFTVLPNAGYNPDDGVKLGLIANYTVNGFDRKPYSQRHQFQFNYFFATDAIEGKYKGTFMKLIGKWNLDLNAVYTSPTFSRNYFGLGNETINQEQDLGMDYNRVRLQQYYLGPSFFRIFKNQGRLDLFANYSHHKVERNLDRIVNQDDAINNAVFTGQNFGEIGASYLFKNYDNASLPTLGMTVFLTAKWVNNLDNFDRNFQYTEANIGFTHKITHDGRLTIASMVKGKAVFGDGYEFYQAAFLGGDQDLRGYRFGRFTGEQAFLQSTDLRMNLMRVRTFVPLRLGVFVGYDYGRIWMKNETSDKWHNAVGGGIWVNGAKSITGTLSFFKGEDPGRIVFGLNFGF